MVIGGHVTIFLSLVALYILLVAGIGLWSYRRTSNEADFLVAGRSLGPIVGGATLMANQVSAGATLGIVGFHYFSGFSFAWTWPLCWIGWLVAALFVAPKMRDFAAVTLPDYFAMRFDSRSARAISAVLILVAYSGLLSAQFQAGGLLFNLVAGIPYPQAVALVAGITVLYTVLGGMVSNAYVGMLKAVLLIGGYAVAVPFLFHNAGGLHSLGEALHGIDPRLTGFYFSVRQLIDMGLILGLGLAAAPYEISAIYSLQSRRAARQAIGYSFVFQGVIGVGILFFGLQMRKIVPFLPNADLATPVLGTSILPVWVGMAVLLGVVVTFTRTGGAVLLTAASALSHDLYIKLWRPSASEREKVVAARTAVALMAVLPVLIALGKLDLVNFVVLFSARLIACCFFAAVVIGLNWKRGTPAAALWSMIGGATSYLVWTMLAHPYFIGIDPAEAGLVIGILLFVGVSLVTKSAPAHSLSVFFPSVEPVSEGMPPAPVHGE
jgi:SSS family transporter